MNPGQTTGLFPSITAVANGTGILDCHTRLRRFT